MKYNISFTDAELRVMAKHSHDVALRLIDSILESNASLCALPTNTSSVSPGLQTESFGSFQGSADKHPLLNKILYEYVSPYSANRNSVKIPAIKFIRSITGWGLADSKNFIESARGPLGMKLFP